MLSIPAFVINTDETVFKNRVLPRFLKAGVDNIIRFQAVRGRDLDLVSLVHQGFLSPVALSVLEGASPRYLYQDFPGVNAIGCFLSHCKVWQTIADRYPQGALIFEEDAHVTRTNMKDVLALLTSLQSDRAQNLCALHFGYLDFATPVDKTRIYVHQVHGQAMSVVEHTQNFSGLQGYYLSQEAAKRLLAHIFPMQIQIDNQLGRLYHAQVLPPGGKVLFTYPRTLVHQLSHRSFLQSPCNRCKANTRWEHHVVWMYVYTFVIVMVTLWLAHTVNI